MGYSSFRKIKTVSKKFGLDVQLVELFSDIPPVQPSPWLQESLAIARLMPTLNEKSKAERFVSPILLDVAKEYVDKISLFSGEEINVSPSEDLSGECDFFFALHPPKPFIDAPIISLTESKDEDMEWGMAQCAAQMYGAKLYNEQEKKPISVIYGCATDGFEWRFLKLEDKMYSVDRQPITELSQILGVWHYIINFYLKNHT